MSADLLPDSDIPDRADRLDSPSLVDALQRLQHADQIISNAVDGETQAALMRLAALGLADPGYDGAVGDVAYVWLSNWNGERVLRNLAGEDSVAQVATDEAAVNRATWLP